MATRKRKEDDFRAEIDAHLAQEIEALISDGLTPEEAAGAARKAFGNRTMAEERFYESRRWMWGQNVVRDVRFAARVLRKDLAFTLLAVTGLALGIGISTAVFALINEMIRINTEESGGLKGFVSINRLDNGRWLNDFSYEDFRLYSGRTDSLRAVTAGSGRFPFVLAAPGREAEDVSARFVSANFQSATNLHPLLGRTFTAAEESGEGPLVAMLSAWYWRMHFGSDREVLGRNFVLNAHQVTVIGVADARYGAGDTSGLYLPLGAQPALLARGDWVRDTRERWLMLDAVLQPGISPRHAEEQLTALSPPRAASGTADPTEGKLVLTPGGGTPRKRRMLLTLAISVTLGVAMILMIASTNLANLLLARAVARRREIAVRLSLGATRTRLVAQLLTESLLLALAGGVLGIFCSHWMAQALFLQFGAPNGYQLRVDPRVLLYGVALSLATGLAFGLAPALSATRTSLVEAFHADTHSPRTFAARNWLVIVPLAFSLMLLLGAGMAVRGVQRVYLNGPVFDTTRLIAAGSPLHLQGYDEARTREFQNRLRDRVRALPGVQSVALASTLPLLNAMANLPVAGSNASTDYNVISPEFFRTVGPAVVRGRDFTAADRQGTAPVALVNREFARRIWPNQDPVGKQVRLRAGTAPFQVVGVAPDMEDPDGVFNTVRPTVYIPEGQAGLFLQGSRTDVPPAQLRVLVRTAGDPAPVKAAVRQEALALDRSLRVEIQTAAEIREAQIGPFRTISLLLSALGGLALVMASVGIYAILAYSVSRRTREIGIHMALGAQRSQVLRLVMQRTAAVILWGIGFGMAGALVLRKILASTVDYLGGFDPVTCAAVTLLLGLVALLASYLPARKALRVDPVRALRWE